MSRANRDKREQKLLAPPTPPRGTVRARRRGWIAGGLLSLLVVAGLAVFAAHDRGAGADGAAPPSGLQTGLGPWAPGATGLSGRMKSSGVPMSDMSAVALHMHPVLSIIVDDAQLPVPANIGIDSGLQSMAALHTHDDSGTIHVESPVARTYTLGEFFDVWGVRLTKRCVGGYCNTTSKQLAAYVDGRPFDGDPRAIQFKDGERLVLIYGTKSEIAANAP